MTTWSQYRKKPVVISAVQWFPGIEVEGTEEIGAGGPGDGSTWPAYLIIKTLEGPMTANPGDYIIRGVENELYPCKPSIFAATYEVVEVPR